MSPKLTHPDYYVSVDEVGVSTNMKGADHIGGEKFLCEAGVIPQQKILRNDKHFILCSLTFLNSMPLICAVIFSEKRENNIMGLGVDLIAEKIGTVSDAGYMLKIYRKKEQIFQWLRVHLSRKHDFLYVHLVSQRFYELRYPSNHR